MIHDASVIQDDGAEFANGTPGELFDMSAVGIHAMENGGHQMGRAAAEDGVFAAGR